MDVINCVECGSDLDEQSLEIEDIEYVTAEDSGTVGGEYHIHVSINCQDGCHLTTTLHFFPAGCPCVSKPEVDDHKQYDIIEQNTRYLKNPTGFHTEGYGWEIIMECPRCDNQKRSTYTIPGLTPKKLE